MADITRYGFISHLRADPTTHVRHLRNGKVRHDGAGQAFWFRPLNSSLSEIPVDDREQPLLFHARTLDFQDITVQATVTYRVVDPALAATRLDFSIDPDSGTTPEETLAAVREDVRGTTLRRITAGMTRLEGRQAAEPAVGGGGAAGGLVRLRPGRLSPRWLDHQGETFHGAHAYLLTDVGARLTVCPPGLSVGPDGTDGTAWLDHLRHGTDEGLRAGTRPPVTARPCSWVAASTC